MLLVNILWWSIWVWLGPTLAAIAPLSSPHTCTGPMDPYCTGIYTLRDFACTASSSLNDLNLVTVSTQMVTCTRTDVLQCPPVVDGIGQWPTIAHLNVHVNVGNSASARRDCALRPDAKLTLVTQNTNVVQDRNGFWSYLHVHVMDGGQENYPPGIVTRCLTGQDVWISIVYLMSLPGWAGCTARDSTLPRLFPCSVYAQTCNRLGTCLGDTVNDKVDRCVCNPGRFGPECTQQCQPLCISNQGQCVRNDFGQHNLQCLCNPGFVGADCSISFVDVCTSSKGDICANRGLCDVGR